MFAPVHTLCHLCLLGLQRVAMARGATALLVAAGVACAAALDITVPFGKAGAECFYERVEMNNKLTGSYEVISGGFLDVDVDVRAAGVRRAAQAHGETPH